MIVREIKDNPVEVLKNFDWFNNYKDTRAWAQRNCVNVVTALDAGWKLYCAKDAFNFLLKQLEKA